MKDRLLRLLRWSEKYTRTDMLYLAHGGFWTTLSYVFGVLAGLITTVALANLIDPNTYGTYQFVLSIVAILSVFTLTGMGLAVNRAVAQGRDGAFRYGVRTKLRWSIGITLAGAAVALYYYLNNNDTLALSILLAGALSPFLVSFRLYEHYLSGKRLFRHAAIIEIVRKLLPFTALLTALFLTDNVTILVTTYFASNALSYLLAYYYVLRSYQPPFEPDPDAFTFSKHLSVMRVISTIASHADKVLIWHFLGATAVATFTIAQLATRYSGGVLNAMTSIALPKLAARDLSTLQQTLPRKVLLFSGAMAIAALSYILIAPFVFPLLFPLYPEAVPLTQLLALTLLFVPRSLYSKALTAHACTRELYLLGIINPTIKLTALAVCLPLFGLWGAVYAFIISGALEAMVVYVLFKRATPKKVPAADPDAAHANQE